MSHLRTSVAAAAIAAFALTGCSSSSDSGKSAPSSATSAAGGAASSATSSASSSASSAAESGSASASESGSASASSSAGASNVEVPADSQMVKAPTNKLTFAVPKAWTVINADSANDDAVKKALEPVAKKAGTSPENYIKQATSAADVLAIDASGADPQASDNINVLKVTRPSVPDKAQLDKELNQINRSGGKMKVTTGAYSRITSPAGAGAQETYTLVAQNITIHGVSIVVPNGNGSYSMVTVSAGSEAKAKEYAKNVVDTAQKM